MRPAIILALLLLAISYPSRAQETCGGSERWRVKVATDARATDIDITSITNATVVDLNNPELRPKGANKAGNQRLDQETKVYRITGFLRFARSEADGDYHIVITDVKSAPYVNGTGKAPTGKSMVAESPDPDCLGGAHGDGPATSRFLEQFRAVHETLDCNLANSLDTRLALPVTITGVLFFDFDHGQLGRATNVAELHPILGIEFDTPASACSNAPFQPS
jgi:hypothetical protein